MEMIAPMAKVLAEANGIDWTKITGTGTAGQIVEEDIINYLTRVMVGDEEPPTTPVDPPPPNWNEDMANMDMPNMDALAAAGIDDDITHFIANTRGVTTGDSEAQNNQVQSNQTESNQTASPSPSLDAMDFELELDENDDDHPPITRDPEEMANVPQEAEYAGASFTPSDPIPAVPPLSTLDLGTPINAVASSNNSVNPQFVEPSQAVVSHPISEPIPTETSYAGTGEETASEQSGWHDPSPTELSTPQPAPVQPVSIQSAAAQTVTETNTPPPSTQAATALPVLRLSFNASALSTAQSHLALHFQRPVSLAVFVARAAIRHSAGLGIDQVSVYHLDSDSSLTMPNLNNSFQDALQDYQDARKGEMAPLMVIHAGEVGLDEVEWPGQGMTLSLGQIRDERATLTLIGPVSVRAGALFLQNVAQLLESPIRLMI